MNAVRCPVRRRDVRPAFTLAELLVVITIIGMLAALVSGGLIVSRQAARESATKATIAKLHNIITAKYEEYRTRRVPLGDADIRTIASGAPYNVPANQPIPLPIVAHIRLMALRDIMRMEMPERWSDIQQAPKCVPLTSAPSVYRAYQARCAINAPTPANAPAECLYLIVTIACGPDARRQFHASEIGDTDGDRFPEFLDGWGHPIYFLRWAPGFNDSDVQANAVAQSELDAQPAGQEIQAWTTSNTLTLRQQVAQEDHDPFDPRRLDMSADPTNSNDPPRGWRLVPLIYSGGPDVWLDDRVQPPQPPQWRGYGLATDNSASAGPYVWTPALADSPYVRGWGLPVRDSTSQAWVHYDNIHNHRIEPR